MHIEDFGDLALRYPVALRRHRADVLVLDLVATLVHLADQHQDRLHHVQRLEAGDDDRLAELCSHCVVRLGADHRADMRRPHEAVDPRAPRPGNFGAAENGPDRRRCEDVVAEHAEVAQPSARAGRIASAVFGTA